MSTGITKEWIFTINKKLTCSNQSAVEADQHSKNIRLVHKKLVILLEKA